MKKFLLPLIVSFLMLLAGVAFPIFSSAPTGNYLVLNGGYIKALSADSTSPSSFSFTASINPNTVSGKQIILSIGDKNSGKLHYEIGINGGSLSLVYIQNGTSTTSVTAGNLTAGVWQDIDVEITPSSAALFINGTQVFAPNITNNNLPAIGPDIVVGDSFLQSIFSSNPYKGLIDEVKINKNGSTFILWHLDETRGAAVANDSSGNNLNGTLVGGDSLIHFFGVLPTPTPFSNYSFALPTLNWTRPVLPTLSFPYPANPAPTSVLNPPASNPTPTDSIRSIPRPTRAPRGF